MLGYVSRTLTRLERNYCITRRKLLRVIFGVRKFRVYLAEAKFMVRMDNSTLQTLLRAKEPEGQMARWSQELGTYEFVIIHRPG